MHFSYLLVLFSVLTTFVLFSLQPELVLLLPLLLFLFLLLLLLHFFELFFLLQHPVPVLVVQHAAVSGFDVDVEKRRLLSVAVVPALNEESRLKLGEQGVPAEHAWSEAPQLRAHVVLSVGVGLFVGRQIRTLRESFVAAWVRAEVGLFPSVGPQVGPQVEV